MLSLPKSLRAPCAPTTEIGAAYAAMHARWSREQRARSIRYLIAAAVCGAMMLVAVHLFRELGARVAADVSRGAAEYCGAC